MPLPLPGSPPRRAMPRRSPPLHHPPAGVCRRLSRKAARRWRSPDAAKTVRDSWFAGSWRGLRFGIVVDDIFILPKRVEPRSFPRRQVLIDAIALVRRRLRLPQQRRRFLGPRLRERPEAELAVCRVFDAQSRARAVEAEGVHVSLTQRRVEAEERPVPAGDRAVLLVHPVAQIEPMRDAMTVSEDE